jgi:hypothetical protein
MADLYAKKLESERKTLWATCRLKGLPVGTPERQRIAEHKAKQGAKPDAKPAAKPRARPGPKKNG